MDEDQINITANITFNVNINDSKSLEKKIEQLLKEILLIKQNQINMANTLDEVLADVKEEGTQIGSLATLTAGIKAQLDAVLAGQLPPEVQAKVDEIFANVEANKQAVVDAINANTTTTP